MKLDHGLRLIIFQLGLHSGTVGSTAALHQEGLSFESLAGVFQHVVCLFSLCMCGFHLGSPASSHSSET